MNNLNSVLLEGVFKEDSLLRKTPKGTPVCAFSIISKQYIREDAALRNEISCFDVETRGALAEKVYDKGKEGRGARVVGRLKEEHWTGVDGKIHSKVSIVAEHVEFRPEPVKEKRSSTKKKA